MKILYLSPGVFDKGGIARYNRFQIGALREAFGDECVRVLSLTGRQVGDLEQPFEVAFSGALPLTTAGRFLFAVEAAKEATKLRPDIILCAHVNMGPMALSIARTVGGRLVQNIYGRELWGESALSPPRRAALRRADLVISDCYSTADRALQLGLTRGRVEVVWDCVDTTRYNPGEPNWDNLAQYGLSRSDRFHVLFLGRICFASRYKGFERLLQLVAQLPERFVATVAGKGDFLPDLVAQAAALGISHRTQITGPIHEDHMPDVYRAADAFYLTSEIGPGKGEGIPLTPMEAMACGTPVIVGNQDGSRELLDGGGGWCGRPTDLTSQREYLAMLGSDSRFHATERQVAVARATTVFDYKRFAAATAAALEEALPKV